VSTVAVGIDLGGTSCRVCLIGTGGARLAALECRHEPNMTSDALIDRLAKAVRRVSAQSCPIGAGVGIAGWVDDRGMIFPGMTNLPILAGIPLIERLQGSFDPSGPARK
jgi:predicted NBD/HSP70 family sugar kinase